MKVMWKKKKSNRKLGKSKTRKRPREGTFYTRGGGLELDHFYQMWGV